MRSALIAHSLTPLRGSPNLNDYTQGSQSLALGLTLSAAPQLVSAVLRSIGSEEFKMMRVLPAIIIVSCVWSASRAQQPAPKFSDYPVRIMRTGSPGKVRVYSTADTSCFRTMLRQTARQGVRFAGHYAIDYWGCGTNCARIGIVDLNNGRAYVSPFYVGIAGGGQHKSIKTIAGSKLVLVNDPEVVREEYGDPAPEEFAPGYFLWTGRQLLPIREGKVESVEPKRAFEPCSKKDRF